MAINIGIFGLGTVGGGVIELLKNDKRFKFCKAFVRDLHKARRGIPTGLQFVLTPEEILNDPNIDCIVEVMGGTGLAWDVMKSAIENDKHVVTANKSVISLRMNNLIQLLESHPKVRFLYEAAVCGGIPIINSIQRSLAPDQIHRIVGIMNGTTNYMLSEMSLKGMSYGEVLKKAQELGYAEADPSADVEGNDACSKLCILSKLAFGVTVDESQVPRHGISQIETTDFEYGKMMGHTIKLLGIAEKVVDHQMNGTSDKQHIALSVCPVMVPITNPLAHVNGATNAIEIDSSNLGRSLYVGPGAGRYPTANSVAADLLELLVNPTSNGRAFTLLETVKLPTMISDHKAEFYIRITVVDHVGVIFKISEVLMKHNIPIFSILQTPIKDKHRVPFAIITESCRLSDINAMIAEVKHRRSTDLHFVVETPLCLRYFSADA